MQLIVLYLVTAAVFFSLDAAMLRIALRPLFARQHAFMRREKPLLLPAVLYYLVYVAAILWFVSWPALEAELPSKALANGAFLGAVSFGSHQVNNYSIMRDWSPLLVVVDVIWGALLTAVAAVVGVLACWIFLPVMG